MFRPIIVSALLACTASWAHAQTPPPPPAPPQAAMPRGTKPPQPPPPPAPPRRGQAVNVKVELTITDQRGGAAPIKKTVSVIVGDLTGGMIRSESMIPNVGTVPLHVDAEPEILQDGKIRLRFSLQYDLPNADEKVTGNTTVKTQIRENLSLILESGKPILATQSADPVTDRQVTVEVKATILK